MNKNDPSRRRAAFTFCSALLTMLIPVYAQEASLILEETPSPAAAFSMIEVAGGTFTMGRNPIDPDSNEDEVRHEVTLRGFLIGNREVTQEEWMSLMKIDNPSSFRGNDLPVNGISWYDALVYCNVRSLSEGLTPCYSIKDSVDPLKWKDVPVKKDGSWDKVVCDFSANGYRLPTEAEWEFASRGGVESKGYIFSGGNKTVPVGWSYDTGTKTTMPVATKQPNELGLYDMSGNINEWCWDWYGPYPAESVSDPVGPKKGEMKVFRGGSWGTGAMSQRCTTRYKAMHFRAYNLFGLRVARSK
jgi:sulfatase modifying factor 1